MRRTLIFILFAEMGSLPFRGTAHEVEYGASIVEAGLAWEILQRILGPDAASQHCNQPSGQQRFLTSSSTTELMNEFFRPRSAERAKFDRISSYIYKISRVRSVWTGLLVISCIPASPSVQISLLTEGDDEVNIVRLACRQGDSLILIEVNSKSLRLHPT